MATGRKVVLIGDFEVGKTSIFTRFKTGVFPEEPPDETRRSSDCKKIIDVDGKKIEFSLHDTAGMERYEGTVPPSYFRSASAVMFVYALDNQESIANVMNWSDSVCPQRLEFVGTSANIIRALVGNKSDLDRTVSHNRAVEVADQCGIKKHMVFEISAKNGYGFDDVFVTIAREILSQQAGGDSPQPVINLQSQQKQKHNGSGCCASS